MNFNIAVCDYLTLVNILCACKRSVCHYVGMKVYKVPSISFQTFLYRHLALS